MKTSAAYSYSIGFYGNNFSQVPAPLTTGWQRLVFVLNNQPAGNVLLVGFPSDASGPTVSLTGLQISVGQQAASTNAVERRDEFERTDRARYGQSIHYFESRRHLTVTVPAAVTPPPVTPPPVTPPPVTPPPSGSGPTSGNVVVKAGGVVQDSNDTVPAGSTGTIVGGPKTVNGIQCVNVAWNGTAAFTAQYNGWTPVNSLSAAGSRHACCHASTVVTPSR